MISINIGLDTQSIDAVIRKLAEIKKPLEDCAGIVDALATEGANEAQTAYGDFGVEALALVSGSKGSIFVFGDMPLIAEFGAGDATEDPGKYFENSPYTPVTPGSYSLLEGSKEYWNSRMETGQGRWHFGGEEYHEVKPHLGLYKAKMRLIDNYVSIVKEEMGL